MSLYDVKSSYDFFKIIKKHHHIYNDDHFNISIIKDADSYIQKLKNNITSSSKIDFSFALNYINKCKNYYKISFKQLSFFIFTIGKLKKKEIKHLCNSMMRINTIIQLYNMRSNYNFYILMNPLKRYLPENGFIKAQHINGGFTYIGDNEIFIVRKEEYEKVIIHELLHHNNRVHTDNFKHENILDLKRFFKIHFKCDLYPVEAIVETYASILNIAFYAIELKKSFKYLWNRELKHYLEVCKKIIDYQNNNEWYEESNTYCYVIFKTILFKYFNKFLKTNDTISFLKKYSLIIKKDILKTKYNDRRLKLNSFM